MNKLVLSAAIIIFSTPILADTSIEWHYADSSQPNTMIMDRFGGTGFSAPPLAYTDPNGGSVCIAKSGVMFRALKCPAWDNQ